MALTAFFCRYKGVNGVLLVGIKALTAFFCRYKGVNGVFLSV